VHSHHQVQAKPDWKVHVQPLVNPGRAAKPDHWKSVTRTKLPTALQAHKPADSGVPVGSGARICRHRDVTRFDFKQPWRTTCKSLENRRKFPTSSA